MTENLYRIVNSLIQEFLLESSPDPLDLRLLAIRENVLPILVDMGGIVAINAEGDVVSFTFDDLCQPKIENDPRIRNITFFQGSRKYPELKGFLPLKSPDDQVCPHCQGTGLAPSTISQRADNLVCYCGGLGWIPY